MKPNKFFSSIPLLIIGGLLLKLEIHGDDYCAGMPDGLARAALIIWFGCILLFITLVSLFRTLRRRQRFNFFPLILTFIIIVSYFLIDLLQSEKFQSPTILFAFQKGREGFESAKIELKQNNTFTVTRKYAEAVCFNSGGFALNSDTLRLKKDIPAKTDFVFSSTYLIDTVAGYLYPLDFGDYYNDSSRWLVITGKDRVSTLNLRYQSIK